MARLEINEMSLEDKLHELGAQQSCLVRALASGRPGSILIAASRLQYACWCLAEAARRAEQKQREEESIR